MSVWTRVAVKNAIANPNEVHLKKVASLIKLDLNENKLSLKKIKEQENLIENAKRHVKAGDLNHIKDDINSIEKKTLE